MKTSPARRRSSGKSQNPPSAEPAPAESLPSIDDLKERTAQAERDRIAMAEHGMRQRNRATVSADSLWGALGTETRRRAVCDWLFGLGLTNTKCARQIEETFGIRTTPSAVRFFYQQHSFLWKIGQAKSQAEIEKGQLPSNWEARIREALAQRRFEAVYQALTDKQILAFEKLDLEKRKVDLKASEVFLTERRLILLEKKMQDAQSTLQDSTITAEEQARRIRKILGQE
ncbi:MAG TPA: hypothetical protein VK961_21345 [Chthoniobacter sp.]|nr:hypothetical protein [Chthoniobacter sp.]